MKKHIGQILSLTLILFLSNAQAVQAEDLNLTKEGIAQSEIILGESATPTEQYAAEELQRLIKHISSADVPILSADSEKISDAKIPIFIGTPDSSDIVREEVNFSTDHPEEIHLTANEKHLILAGKTPRAALYATYTFLQDVLGVRWFWPGDDGEYFPTSPTLAVPEFQKTETPGIANRYFSLTSVVHGYNLETDIWMARNRLNIVNLGTKPSADLIAERKARGFLLRIAGHNVKLPQETLDAHPEYGALFAGKRIVGDPTRPPQLCWSNPQVVELVSQQITDWASHSPGVDIIAFYPADTTQFCQCEECKKMAPDVSTRWQLFSSQIIENVKEVHPDKTFWTLAYMAYRSPPDGALAPFGSIGYCLYNGCYRHPLSENCPGNEVPFQEIKEWQKQGASMGIRGYEFIVTLKPMFLPILTLVADQIVYSHENKLNSWTSELPPYGHPAKAKPEHRRWETNRLALYAAAQLMWNSNQSAEALLEDWMTHIYGPAAKPMKEYYLALEKAWRSAPSHVSYFLLSPASLSEGFISPKLIQEVQNYFNEAKAALLKIENIAVRDRAMAQWDLDTRMFKEWETLYLLRNERASHYQQFIPKTKTSPSLTADQQDPAWENAHKLPAFEDMSGTKVQDQTDTYALWDSENLYLRFICHDRDPESLYARFKEHDASIYSDDSIEIFLLLPAIPGGYGHLVFNSLGTRSDSLSRGGMNLEQDWNPNWKVTAKQTDKGWIADVVLPFKSFEINPGKDPIVELNIKRTRPGKRPEFPHSGWPDASYHNPHESGKLLLREESPAPVAVFAPNVDATALLAELRKLMPVTHVKEMEDLDDVLSEKYQGLVFRYTSSKQKELGSQLWQNQLLPYLEQGGRILLIGNNSLHFEDWLPEKGLNVAYSERNPDANRRTVFLKEGEWLSTPHDLSKIFAQGTTPGAGFFPQGDAWETLATMQLQSGEECPYLLMTPFSEGVLYLTSSALGFSGRHEIFGDLHSARAAQLIQNLFYSK